MYTITLTPVGETLLCRPDETVLAAILRSGASVVFGCRGGGCGTCKMRATAGQVDHGRCSTAVLGGEDRAHRGFLSCQARAGAPAGHGAPSRRRRAHSRVSSRYRAACSRLGSISLPSCHSFPLGTRIA